jgi:hypothetical protein
MIEVCTRCAMCLCIGKEGGDLDIWCGGILVYCYEGVLLKLSEIWDCSYL